MHNPSCLVSSFQTFRNPLSCNRLTSSRKVLCHHWNLRKVPPLPVCSRSRNRTLHTPKRRDSTFLLTVFQVAIWWNPHDLLIRPTLQVYHTLLRTESSKRCNASHLALQWNKPLPIVTFRCSL